MLKTRIITALCIVPIVLLAIFLSKFTRVSLAFLIFCLINYEFLSFATSLNQNEKIQTLMSLIILPISYLWNSWTGFAAGIFFSIFLIFLFQIIRVEKSDYLNKFSDIAFAYCYTGLLGSLFVITSDRYSAELICYLLAIVVASDTLAYFVGRTVGGPRLAPTISPNKTISGGVGGVIAAMVVAYLFADILQLSGGSFAHTSFGLVVAILAIFGDLLESLAKRTYNVKDSSNFLPGHGGVLDRVDALMFSLIALFLVNF